MTFDMKIKFDGRTIQKAKAQNIEDLEPVIKGLKDKFGSSKRRKQ